MPSARAAAEFYHGHCVRLLIDLTAEEYDNDERTQGLALASVCLLRSYEILSGEILSSYGHHSHASCRHFGLDVA